MHTLTHRGGQLFTHATQAAGDAGINQFVPHAHDHTAQERRVLSVVKLKPGAKLRVRNHGLPRGDGYGRGNLVVQVQVDVPKKITAEQEELLQRFDELDGGPKKGKKATKKTIFEKVKDIFS